MGLDMYLRRKKYVKNWDFTAKEKQFKVDGNVMIGEEIIDLSDICYLEFSAIYWRKANAIHQWFVENVQENVDDCGTYYVGLEKLKKLLNTINTCLADRNECDKLLPVQEGFFFGNTEYDEHYFEELERTRDKLSILIHKYPHDEYYYHSSW